MLVSVCVPGERSSGTFFAAGTRGDFETSAFRRFSVEIAVSFRGPGKGTGISGILRDLIQSRGAPRRGKGKKPASRTKAGMPSPPSVRMKCGTKITPCGETPLGAASAQKKTRLKSATAPRERRAAKTPRASGGCALQARRMCGFSPSARFASRMGLRLFRPVGARRSRAWERCAFPRSSGAPCQKSLKLKGQSLKRSLCEQISKARETRTRLFEKFVQFVDKKSARIREICGRKICAGGISTKRLMSEAWSHAASFRAQRRRWPGRAGAAAGVAGFGAELRRR